MAYSDNISRLSRLTAVLLKLQSKPYISIDQLVQQFEVSRRTIYRDLSSLEQAGVPIIKLEGKGYGLIEGYNIPPIMFTEEEAISFLLAEKFIEKMTDDKTKELYKSALFKIKAVLRSSEKDTIEHLDQHIEISKQYQL